MCFLLSLIISAIADFVNDYNHKKYKIISIALFFICIYLKNKKSCPKARLFCIFLYTNIQEYNFLLGIKLSLILRICFKDRTLP